MSFCKPLSIIALNSYIYFLSASLARYFSAGDDNSLLPLPKTTTTTMMNYSFTRYSLPPAIINLLAYPFVFLIYPHARTRYLSSLSLSIISSTHPSVSHPQSPSRLPSLCHVDSMYGSISLNPLTFGFSPRSVCGINYHVDSSNGITIVFPNIFDSSSSSSAPSALPSRE